ncbi:MAG: diguanylate cyclase [Nitrospiria bacterium]
MVDVFIIGAGRGGKAVLSRLLQFNWIRIVGVSDINPEAPAILLARKSGLPIFIEDPFPFLHDLSVDLVFDLTGNPIISTKLLNFSDSHFDVATGEVAQLLWKVILELEEKEAHLKKQLGERQVLLDISLMLSRSETPDQIFEAIVAGVIRITGMPAGSLSVYNREKQELFLVATKGFSSEFYKNAVYPVRSGGLTEHILSQKKPILVPDIGDYPAFNNPIIVREGIRSLIAIPLISEKGPVGILYSDDFKPRDFPSSSLMENLQMLATQAVIAIQKQQAFEKIKELSIRDPLTGLYNRRYLNKVMTSEIGRASRLHSPLSVILIDVDYFKLVNDKFGHLIGDQLLQSLSQSYESIIRPYDVLARFGGEEFLILMSETDEVEAVASAERLRHATETGKFLPDSSSITCSVGVCTFRDINGSMLAPKEVIRCADEALYLAKREGRNRVCLHKNE